VTQFGLDYRYNYDTMMNAIHDLLTEKNIQKTGYGREVLSDKSKKLF